MIRMLGARGILLALGSLGAAGCMPGTTLVPGDPTRFDPVARFPSVAAYAGSSTKFVALAAAYVREDGTIDLLANYVDGVAVRYTFVEPTPPSPDAGFPLGARGPQAPPLRPVYVTIRLSQPEENDGFQGGMRRGTILSDFLPGALEQWQHFERPTPAPRCHFAALWTMARDRGAPAGAVAVIVYDPTGYRFRIDGTPFKLAFDTSCNPKE